MSLEFSTITSALAHRASTTPEEPWLFFRPALDWRWRSWGQMAAAVSAAQVSVAQEALRGEPTAPVIGPAAGETPALVAEQLAREAAGHAGKPGEKEWVARAREAFAALGSPSRRDILVASGPPDADPWRLLLAWSVLTGAALALEPDPEAWPSAVRWVRPTVLAGTAADLRRGRSSLGAPRWRRRLLPWARRNRRLRPPLDRLRGVVAIGEEALEVEEQAYWRSLGVVLAGVGAPGPAE